MAGRVSTGEFVSREQVRVPGKCPMVEPLDYKTVDGKSASIYRTHVWRAWPGLKNVLTLLCCSTCTFVLGPSLFVGMLWACPQQLSIAVGALYGLHVLFGNAMHKGNLESYRWKAFDVHLAVMEYFHYQLLIEDDLVLKPERKYIVGTHPHGVYALGQLPFMFTSRHNPLFQLFPFLANTVHMTGASVIYYIPLVREMFLFCGFVVVSKPTLVHWLHRKHSVGIVKYEI